MIKVDNIKTFGMSFEDKFWAESYFYSALDSCVNYILKVDGITSPEVEKYSQEIKDIFMFTHLNGYAKGLVKLSQTGVFHDAVGKVIETTDSEIIYTTEY